MQESSGIDKANCVLRIKINFLLSIVRLFGPLIELGGRKDLLACSCRRHCGRGRDIHPWGDGPDTETQREAFPYPPFRPLSLPSLLPFSQNFSSAHCQAFLSTSAHNHLLFISIHKGRKDSLLDIFVLRWKEKNTQISASLRHLVSKAFLQQQPLPKAHASVCWR